MKFTDIVKMPSSIRQAKFGFALENRENLQWNFLPSRFLRGLTHNYGCYFCQQSPFDLLVLDQNSSQAGFVVKPLWAPSESDSQSAGGSCGAKDARESLIGCRCWELWCSNSVRVWVEMGNSEPGYKVKTQRFIIRKFFKEGCVDGIY